MTMTSLPDIPRSYTALAEWLACVIYILPLKKRINNNLLYPLLALFALTQWGIQHIAGLLPLSYWLPGMLVAMIFMYIYIYICCDISTLDVGYCFARAFIAAEFTASLEWQIYYYCLQIGIKDSRWLSSGNLISIYAIVFTCIFFIDSKKLPGNNRLGVNRRTLGSSILMAFATFLMNNINFAVQDSIFISSIGAGLLYIRTLVDFSGLLMLFAQEEQRREMQLRLELEAMNNVLHRQYEQYQQSKESIEIINRKYHDLKHQIAIIRKEKDPEKKESYLEEMDSAIGIYEAQNKTGNTVLDTVLTGKNLYCTERNINMTCVADGSLLHFMSVTDICTIIGNALDNAIESVEKLDDIEKRLIRVAIFAQNDFLMLRFENYFEEMLKFEDGLPATTKKDKGYHGYGIKSVRQATEKYGGNLTIHTDDNWFTMRILIPLTQN